MYNDRDEEVTEAGPSTPVRVAGLNEVPNAGDRFLCLADDDIDIAREVAEQRRVRGRTELLARRGGPRSLQEFLSRRDGTVKDLPLIIKADTPGSLEALRHELSKLQHDEVRVQVIHEAVGGVNESDVYLASSAGAIILAFHVIPEDRAVSLAEQEGVEIRRYNIIYNVTDDIRQALEGLLRPERVEVATGRALVLRTFSIARLGVIAGCRVLNGTIERSNRVHVIRDQKILNDYAIASLKREKDDVRDVRDGLECGIRLEGFNDVKEGDLLEAFRIEERKRSLDL
jgi:translation initiation factor IF-2